MNDIEIYRQLCPPFVLPTKRPLCDPFLAAQGELNAVCHCLTHTSVCSPYHEFLKINLKRRAPVRGLLRRNRNHRQIHLWNFCSDQRRLIFMPTARPSLNAFAMFALGTS